MDQSSGTCLKIQFQIVGDEESQNIYFKRDGQRFGQEYTLKLKSETKYRCTITIKPSIPLQSVSAQETLVNLIDLTKQNGSSTYEFDWPTTFPPNKNKKRTDIPILLKFQDGLSLTMPLQVKFYDAESSSHLHWGQQLHFIDYDCLIKPERSSITIEKSQFY